MIGLLHILVLGEQANGSDDHIGGPTRMLTSAHAVMHEARVRFSDRAPLLRVCSEEGRTGQQEKEKMTFKDTRRLGGTQFIDAR